MTACWNRRVALVAAGFALIGLTAACHRGPAPARDADPRADAARLQRANAQLQKQIDLAGGKEFYLVLDPSEAGLTLMLKGAQLQRFAVRGLQVGYPRVGWMSSRDPRHVQSAVWSGGELDPPRQIDRLVIQAGEPGKDAAEPTPPPIPPTPEELYPVPSRYHIRFADGLSVEIRPREADTTVGWWPRTRASAAEKWRDILASLRTQGRDAIRLRIALDPGDARSLYRSLPPAVRLLVLDGDGGVAAQAPAAVAPR